MPRRSEKRPYRNGRLALPACKPLQRPKIGFRKRRNPFVGNYTSRMAKPRIWAVLRLLWLRLHELQDIASVSGRGHCRLPTVANLWHEGKKWAIGLVAWKSAVHRKPIAITRFAAHLSRPKMPDITTLAFGLYITYRAILNIELYNWQPQKR